MRREPNRSYAGKLHHTRKAIDYALHITRYVLRVSLPLIYFYESWQLERVPQKSVLKPLFHIRRRFRELNVGGTRDGAFQRHVVPKSDAIQC